MKYSSSINGLLNYFKDTSFWQLNQYSNELKNYRQDISGQWDDNAASEIQNQYLNPHEEDETVMRGWFEKQYQSTQQLSENLDKVEAINEKIISISEEIRILISESEEDLRNAVTNFDFSSNRKNDADIKITTITSQLSAANQGEYSSYDL